MKCEDMHWTSSKGTKLNQNDTKEKLNSDIIHP